MTPEQIRERLQAIARTMGPLAQIKVILPGRDGAPTAMVYLDGGHSPIRYLQFTDWDDMFAAAAAYAGTVPNPDAEYESWFQPAVAA